MTEKIKCPCCGSEDIQVRGPYPNDIPCHCFACPCEWDESKRQPSNAWIPCSERLPEEGKLVLVCVIVGERAPFAEPAYHEDGWWWASDSVTGWQDEESSHWMPLPDLPQLSIERKED